MKNHFKYLIFLFIVLSCSFLKAQDHTFTGYATSIVNQDRIVQINTFGYKNIEKKIKYTNATIQPIGSVSKTFIGISLMIAEEKGLIDLDTDINNYLDFKITNPNIKGNNSITLRQLATHTSGIKDNSKKYFAAYNKGMYKDGSLRSFLFNYLSESGNNYNKRNFNKSNSGSIYEYSNIGAALAAYIIERISGQSFNEFTTENIFEPIGMNSTSWFYKNLNLSNASKLYDEKDKKLALYHLATYPDGGLKTTIEDLSKYLIELIKGYNGKSTILSNKSWKVFYKKNFSVSNTIKDINPKEPNSGIFIVYFKSGKIGHTGSDPGVSCIMMFDPKTNIGKIFMANEDLTKDNLKEFKKIWKEL